MSFVVPSRIVGSKNAGPRSGRALPPVTTVAPLATASSTCDWTRSWWSGETSEPTSMPKSYDAPTFSASVAATNLLLNSS